MVDAESGLVHTAGVTTGKVHDAKVMGRLLREDDTAVYGDKGYVSEARKRAAEAAGVLGGVRERTKPGRDLTQRQRARNRRFAKVRAKVEHVFRVLKCQFGYRKVRYRGNGVLVRCDGPWSRSKLLKSVGLLRASLQPSPVQQTETSSRS